MGLHQVPEFDSASSLTNDNSFAGPRSEPTGKISVKLPVDEWLCCKMDKLNLTIVHGYLSRSSEASVDLPSTSSLRYPSHRLDSMTSTLTRRALLFLLFNTCAMGQPS